MTNTKLTRETDPPALRAVLEFLRSQALEETPAATDEQVDRRVRSLIGPLTAFARDRREHHSIRGN